MQADHARDKHHQEQLADIGLEVVDQLGCCGVDRDRSAQGGGAAHAEEQQLGVMLHLRQEVVGARVQLMVDGVQLEANHDHRGVADDDAEEHIGVDRFNPPDPVEDSNQHQC